MRERKNLRVSLLSLFLIFFLFFFLSGQVMGGMEKGKILPKVPPTSHPGIEKAKKRALPLLPDIRADLRWEFVRYTGSYNREAIIRLIATFTNQGGHLTRCPDPPCMLFLRSLEPSSPPRVREVLQQREFSQFRAGQTITLTKEIRVYCAEEFSPKYEAGADVNCNPRQYFYHDPDYLRPRLFDSNIKNNFKVIDQDDIENALWDYSCRPLRR